MALGRIPVPVNHPVIDGRTGLITRPWSEYFLALANGADYDMSGYMAKAVYDPTGSGVVADSNELGGVQAGSYIKDGNPGLGIPYFVQASAFNPAGSTAYYFGQLPKTPVTTAGISKVYVAKSGSITAVNLYSYAGTAGSSEEWAVYLRINNSDDYLIATAAASAAERVFSNADLQVSVNAGDYFEIKTTTPAWGTPPASIAFAGYVIIE